VRSLIFILALLVSTQTFGAALKSESELQPFTEKVMQALVKGGTSAAFEVMKPLAIIPDAEFQSVVLTSKAQRDQYGVRYGTTIGYEYIDTKKLGTSLIRITYVEKTQKHALPWMFYFYKTPDGWVLNSFQWNDQLPALFFSN
jgi:hypothetical protein